MIDHASDVGDTHISGILPDNTFELVAADSSVSVLVSQPGTLANYLVADSRDSIKQLTISGTIDARDFVTMRDSLDNLAVLDLSAAVVAEYYGDGGTRRNYDSIYPANELPCVCFLCM